MYFERLREEKEREGHREREGQREKEGGGGRYRWRETKYGVKRCV